MMSKEATVAAVENSWCPVCLIGTLAAFPHSYGYGNMGGRLRCRRCKAVLTISWATLNKGLTMRKGYGPT